MGPLISEAHLATVSSFVPTEHRWHSGGSCPEGPGNWFAAHGARTGRPADRAATEEIFGPVVVVIPFEDEADAVRLANDTPYGLSGRSGPATSAGLCGSARAGRDRDAVGQLACVGPLLDALRGSQAVGHRAASSGPMPWMRSAT